MAKHIIHGIGKLVLRDFREPKKVIGFTDLQDLGVESSSSKDDITGGNKVFPIASFKKDQALKLSGTNAIFNHEMLEYLDGATKATGAVTMTDVLELRIPETKSITLSNVPIAGSVIINGFTSSETEPAKDKFKIVAASKELTFATENIGDAITIIYEYTSTATTTEYSITQKSMPKPFIAEYIFPIYDEDTQIVANAMIRIYKAQCTSGFSIDPKHQTPVAPKFEAEAKDAQRMDGKLWSLFIDGVEV